MDRKITKVIDVGGVKIGGGNRITVQSMCNVDTRNAAQVIEQIKGLYNAGCDIVRLAVPDEKAAAAFSKICSSSPIPVVADIHFDYRLALMCAENGAAKIRINPGNIGDENKVKEVADKCRQYKIPIRIGVNLGSIEKETEKKYGRTAKAMVVSAMEHVRLLNKYDFDDIALSLKASDVEKTVQAYRMISETTNYPLHVGVTEAGTAYGGLIKSSAGIGALLLDGIGDTIRVSLTADPVEEPKAGIALLKALGIRKEGVNFVSCPSCGRCKINLVEIANKVQDALYNVDKNITVAVMGCVVNGPGEAKDADIGIAGGDGCAVLFKKGETVRKIAEENIVDELLREIGEI
ncbi:MAG: flavodoxin-dependent (E)-4-hydroxy-3-methylbut-2-enyl-diphosphate synthase [Clostridia bacterium]|nr:flavodoxin-dependent (E)-4-hydroxy-3-methylbut-2-enyl-diphosphate synthase [Clostridia bacterium]